MSHWDFSVGSPGRSPRRKPAATESRHPTYAACWVLKCFQNPPNSDMDYRIFNARTNVSLMHAITHRGVRTHVRESALKFDFGRKIPCRAGESNLPQRRAGSTVYQLSYIPCEPRCNLFSTLNPHPHPPPSMLYQIADYKVLDVTRFEVVVK